MTGAAALELSATIAEALLLVAMLVTVIRIVIGPTLADRVLALDLLTMLGAAMIAAIAVSTRYFLYLDVAIALGLMGFLSTLAFARYILYRTGKAPGRQEANQ